MVIAMFLHTQLACCHWLPSADMKGSINKGPQKTPQYAMTLATRTPTKGPLFVEALIELQQSFGRGQHTPPDSLDNSAKLPQRVQLQLKCIDGIRAQKP